MPIGGEVRENCEQDPEVEEMKAQHTVHNG